jgi:hypothetical protein
MNAHQTTRHTCTYDDYTYHIQTTRRTYTHLLSTYRRLDIHTLTYLPHTNDYTYLHSLTHHTNYYTIPDDTAHSMRTKGTPPAGATAWGFTLGFTRPSAALDPPPARSSRAASPAAQQICRRLYTAMKAPQDIQKDPSPQPTVRTASSRASSATPLPTYETKKREREVQPLIRSIHPQY